MTKICLDCKHCALIQLTPKYLNDYYCAHPALTGRNLVTGEPAYKTCEQQRYKEPYCDREGNLWEQKEEKSDANNS